MKIDILTNDGSPLSVTLEDLYGSANRVGLGGSEYGMLTLAEAWHKAGHEVVIYNDPANPNGSPWEHRAISSFSPQDERDILIVFRTPNERSLVAKGLKVWLSCDQYTRADADFRKFSGFVHKIVTISPRHKQYFEQTYGIQDSVVIDLPVRLSDLNLDVEKIPQKCIFTSVPDRGLHILHSCWGAIKSAVPSASLTITSDYRLWGVKDARNDPHRVQWMMEKDIRFLGAIGRMELVREQLSSVLMPYPSNYDELFCVAVAEAQACGVYPVTSNTGSLSTTNMGTVLDESGNFKVKFTTAVIEKLNDPDLVSLGRELKAKAYERFSPETILKQWDEKVFSG